MNASSSDQVDHGAAQPSGSPDPGLVKLVEALARAHARRDHLRATGHLEGEARPFRGSRATAEVRLRKVVPGSQGEAEER